MHLARLETFRLETRPASDWLFPSRTWLLVACWTEDGRYGVGEASQSRDDRATEAALRGFEKAIVGLRPEQVMSRLRVHLADANRDRARSAALGALEQAMWDLLGKECALPVTALLGGAMRDAVRLYANIGYAIPAPTPEAYAAAAEAATADGFTAVKIYPFGMRPPASAHHRETRDWLERGVERVAAVRSTVR